MNDLGVATTGVAGVKGVAGLAGIVELAGVAGVEGITGAAITGVAFTESGIEGTSEIESTEDAGIAEGPGVTDGLAATEGRGVSLNFRDKGFGVLISSLNPDPTIENFGVFTSSIDFDTAKGLGVSKTGLIDGLGVNLILNIGLEVGGGILAFDGVGVDNDK